MMMGLEVIVRVVALETLTANFLKQEINNHHTREGEGWVRWEGE